MRRALAIAAIALVVTACVESDPSTIELIPTTTAAGSAPATAAPTGRTSVPSRPAASPRTSTTTVAAPEGGPGSAAGWLLRPSGAASLEIAVLTAAGAEPRQGTLDHLAAVLESASGKAVTTSGGIPAVDRTTWSDDDLRAAAAGSSGSITILFLHGRSADGVSVLGLTVSNRVAAIFSDQVDAAATGLVGPAAIEDAVTTHELGHLLGLVDLFLHTGRADPQHPGHSTDHRSVMYWAVESSVVGDLLTGGPPRDFDDADQADLAAIRHG